MATTRAAVTTTAAGNGDTDDVRHLESPCGEGEDGPAPPVPPTRASPTTQIIIGYGDDAGYQASPGLSHETVDAIEAMIDWCNDQGGINGRQIVGNYYDAAITDVVNAMTQACGEVFMLVGEAWALDAAQEETRLGCGLPAVPTYSVSPEFANAPLHVPGGAQPGRRLHRRLGGPDRRAVPRRGQEGLGDVRQLRRHHRHQGQGRSRRSPTSASSSSTARIEYNIAGEPDWKPFAQKLKDCGAEVVYFSGQPYPNFQNLLDAAAQLDYDPIWLTDSNVYLQSFADWNATGNGDNVYVRTAFTPFEQADEQPGHPAVPRHRRPGNGGDVSQLGEQATSSFLLWATAAKECGADLTRECVLDELSQVTSWTGGGLHAEANPGENMPPECAMLLKLDGTTWVQAYPEQEGEFDCNPDGGHRADGSGGRPGRARREPRLHQVPAAAVVAVGGRWRPSSSTRSSAWSPVACTASPPRAWSSPTRRRASSTSPTAPSPCWPPSPTGRCGSAGAGRPRWPWSWCSACWRRCWGRCSTAW